MEYVFAALLLHKLQKPINDENITKVVGATGVTPDEVKIKALVSALSEINIEDALKNATIAAAAPAAAPAPAEEAKKSESKADDKPKEEDGKKEEEALAGLSSLFG
tara:strand:+ start:1601 stop:1918 length:318 start_codon:yes stop_codon:yes gene_type:complete